MPISVSPSGIQMNDGNTMSLSQSAGILPDQIIDSGSLITIKAGINFDGDDGITTSTDPSFRLTKGDNVYTNYTVINATSSWTVPPGVTKGMVVVIGGGGSGGFGYAQGGDTPLSRQGGAGGYGGVGASYIPLTSGNSMPAVVGAATGTSSFFGIVATGGTNGTSASSITPGVSGTPGSSSTGNFRNGSIGSGAYTATTNYVSSNAYSTLKTVTPAIQAASIINFNTTSGGYPAGTLYQITNIISAGAAGVAGGASSPPAQTTSPGAGLPGAVIVFY